ncbi:MAG TPA: hypothetical protein VK841_17660 [Polyangiaceae bacterium]|nr:hypothetical protein [Polyangiaceae bacterium]
MSSFRGVGRGVGRLARGAIALGVAGVLASALGTGCGSDEGLVGGSCAEGYTQCDNRCVRLTTDADNCGACGQACVLGVACVDGVCGGSADASHEGGADASLDGASADGAVTGGDAGDGASGAENDGASVGAESSTESDAAGATEAGGASDAASGGDATLQGDGASSAAGDATLEGDATLAGDAAPGADATEADGTTEPDGANETDDGGEDGTVSGEEASPDAETGEAASCGGSLSSCSGGCVDTTSDPLNCGTCNNVCVSQFCQDSQCIGTTSGGLIFIGHDYDETSTSRTQSNELSNAVFIPQANPLRVLEYDRYATHQALGQIGSILNAVAVNLGRTLTIIATSIDADIPNSLSLQNYDVFLMPDQSTAPAGALASLGSASGGNWGPTLASFAQNGGVVVVLDGGTGTGEMPQFLTSSGLLDVTAQTELPARTELDDIARGDVESVGLVAPYLSSGNVVSLTTEPNGSSVVYVIVTGGDSGAGAPVVIHKIF